MKLYKWSDLKHKARRPYVEAECQKPATCGVCHVCQEPQPCSGKCHERDDSPLVQRAKLLAIRWTLALSAGGGLAWWIVDAVSHLLTGTKHGASGW